MISSRSLCQTHSRNSQLDAPGQLSAYQAHLPYAGDPEIQELSGDSVVGRKRTWFIWTARKLTLAIVSDPIEAMSLRLNRRRMPERA